MPTNSKKQHNLMAMVANDPAAAKRTGVPQSVGKEFTSADKGKKFSSGTRADSQVANQPKTNHGEKALFKQGGDTMASKMNPGFMAMMAKKKDGMHKMPDGKMMKNSAMKMAEGGKADMKQDKAMAKKAVGMHDKQMHAGKKTDLSMLKKGGKAMTMMAKGGGVESKGKTKGAMVAMKSGGSSKKYC